MILKATSRGPWRPSRRPSRKLGTEDVKVRVIPRSTGAVTETDVMLASASDAWSSASRSVPITGSSKSRPEGVEIKVYDIIYDVIAQLKAAMEGLLSPCSRRFSRAMPRVRNLFRVPRVGTVAGCYVTDGKVVRTASSAPPGRRGGVRRKIFSLKRFKEDAKEVATGYECGIGLENFNVSSVGDVLETYVKEQVERKPL